MEQLLRMSIPVTLVVAVVLASACARPTDNQSGVRIADYGIYEPNRDAPNVLVETTDVPAVVGTVFGIRIHADGRSRQVTYRWTFPRMENPADGQVWTEMSGTQDLTPTETHPFLVRINNDWEAVPGEWTIRLSDGERVIAEKIFHVHTVHPEDD